MRFGRVEVTGGFFLLVAWLNYLDHQLIIPMALAACALHELGHYLAIRTLGGDIQLIRLTAVGAEMVVKCTLGYWQEGLSALAGPGVNLILALIFCNFRWGTTFAGLNLILACFNLIPIGRLDGGRALHCILALLVGSDWSFQVSRWLDVVCTALLFGCGLLFVGAGGNLTLLLVSIWLFGVVYKENYSNINRNRACHLKKKQLK